MNTTAIDTDDVSVRYIELLPGLYTTNRYAGEVHSFDGGDGDSPRPTSRNRSRNLRLVGGERSATTTRQGVASTTTDSTSRAADPTGFPSVVRTLERLGYLAEPLIDYRLQRRAVLRDLRRGSIGIYEVCDASPYLLRAASFFGEPSQIRCPVCRKEPLWRVCFAYGDDMGHYAGQACGTATLPALARRFGECEVYSVEVCAGCSWNHLVEKFLLMDHIPPEQRPPLVSGA